MVSKKWRIITVWKGFKIEGLFETEQEKNIFQLLDLQKPTIVEEWKPITMFGGPVWVGWTIGDLPIFETLEEAKNAIEKVKSRINFKSKVIYQTN